MTQPRFAKRMIDAGWRFEWQPWSGYVQASHPFKDSQSIAKINPEGLRSARNELGSAIADMLNGGTHQPRTHQPNAACCPRCQTLCKKRHEED